MILQPAIIALIVGSFCVCLICGYASFLGIAIIRKWDLTSGSSQQLDFERKTYLISTILGYVMVFEILSLFLLVFTADEIHTMFTGAMCAAGTFFVNGFGYPALIVKLINTLLCGCWLILNHLDNKGMDYPLIRIKYVFLLFITTGICIGGFCQFAWFAGLETNTITSCCGTLFSISRTGVISDIVGVPPAPAMIVFFTTAALTILTGLRYCLTGKAPGLYGVLSGIFFPISLVALLSFICVYYYQLPTHHCPFCILQKEYYYVGYLLYGSLFMGGIFGTSTGIIQLFQNKASIAMVIPPLQHKLAFLALFCQMVFVLTTLAPMGFTDFRLF